MDNGTQTVQVSGVDTSTKIILYSIVLVCSLVGNGLVIAVVLGNANLRTRFNYLIINMAISDLAVPVISMPVAIVQEVRGNPDEWLVDGAFGNALCKLCYFITDVSPGVSILSLVVIAANRFFAIVYPLRLQTSRMKKMRWTIALIWIVAMAIFSPRLYTFRLISGKNYPMCTTSWEPAFDPLVSHRVFYYILEIVVFIIPFTTIIILYSIMLYKIHKMSQHVQNMLNGQQARTRERRKKQIFYISIVVIVVFALFWGPFFGFVFVMNFIWQFKIPVEVLPQMPKILFAVIYLGHINSAINPCMYFLLLKNYRQGLKRLFCARIKSRDAPELTLQHLNTRVSSIISEHGNSGCRLTKIENSQV